MTASGVLQLETIEAHAEGEAGRVVINAADLVEGTMKQQRLLATAPKEVTEDDVAGILARSITLW